MRNLVLLLFLITTISVSAQVLDNPENINPLETGEKMPDVSIKDLENNSVMIHDIVSKGSSIFLFYRGGWCPYCTKHLSDIASVESKIKEMGYTIIAISPDSPDKMKATLEKTELTYNLYSDSDGKLIKAMGIAFKVSDGYKKLLDEHSDGINEGLLPVPALYVVDNKGNVKYRFLSPDYKLRISSETLLKELEKLN